MKTFKQIIAESDGDYHPDGYKKISKIVFDKHMKKHRPHGYFGAVYIHPTEGGVFKGAHHVDYNKDRKERSVQTYSHKAWGLKSLLRFEPDLATGKPHRFYVKK